MIKLGVGYIDMQTKGDDCLLFFLSLSLIPLQNIPFYLSLSPSSLLTFKILLHFIALPGFPTVPSPSCIPLL